MAGLNAKEGTLARVPMLPIDALFWHTEEVMPQIRLQVGGLLMLDRAPDRDRLRTLLRQWAVYVPRLHRRVVDSPLGLGLGEWEDDPHFDLDYHLRELVLPQPGTLRRLLDFAGSAVVTPLDHLRPLWEVYSIGGLEGGKAACLFKLHHSIVDGVGSMGLFEALTQPHRSDPICIQRLRRPEHGNRKDQGAGELLGSAGAALKGVGSVALHPLHTAQRVLRDVAGIGEMIRDFSAHAITDPLAIPDGGIGRRFDTILFPLARMLKIKGALGVTLNNLVLAAVAGAVGRYHRYCGMPVEELECIVPMNLRQANDELVGNHVGAFLIALPVGERHAIRRLKKICDLTVPVKGNGGHSSGSHFLMKALAFVPGVAFRALSQTVSGKLGLICSNFAGPRATRYFAGAKVDAIYPFLPAMFGIPLTVALLSYADTYGVGIDTDPAAIRRPELLCRYIEDAVDELERAVPKPTGRARPYRARVRRHTATRLLRSAPAA